MRHCDVKNTTDALIYITDCNLATIEKMAQKKSRPKGEFERQVRIAQKSIDWLIQFGVDVNNSGTRIDEVMSYGGVVALYAKFYMD